MKKFAKVTAMLLTVCLLGGICCAAALADEEILIAPAPVIAPAPAQGITRAEAAALIYKCAQDAEQGFQGSWMFLLPYSDLDSIPDGGYESIAWCTMKGVLKGYTDGCIGAGDLVTREQFAVMFCRYAEAMGYDVSQGENTNILSFDDVFEAPVSDFAGGAVQWALTIGVLEPVGTELQARGNVTAEQADAAVAAFIEEYTAK